MSKQRHAALRKTRRGERGVALVFATFAIAALLVAIAGALVTGSANSRASSNYTAASRAHFVAEAAVSDALQRINIAGGSGNGILNYQTEVVANWSNGTLWPVNYYPRQFSNQFPMDGYNYTVTTAAGTVPSQQGRLVATATGPDGVRNTVVANIVRAHQPSTAPGAIYLATDDPSNATFQGNSFHVDGNDYNYTGGMGPGPSVPGISTRNSSNSTEAINSLSSTNPDNVQGYGYQAGPPVVPSISTVPWGPTVAQLGLLHDALTSGQTACYTTQLTGSCDCGCTSDGNNHCVCGTTSTPKLTWIDPGDSNKVTIKNTGNIQGAGIMVVDGDLEIQGDVEFKGLILVSGTLKVSGSSLIYGTVWAQGVQLTVSGSNQVYYSTQALSVANTVFPNGALPSPMRIVSLADCSDLAPGMGNCPLL